MTSPLSHTHTHDLNLNLSLSLSQEYLEDDEFAQVFTMPRDEFKALPAWRQKLLKKSAKLS